jgi:hypothetical protein
MVSRLAIPHVDVDLIIVVSARYSLFLELIFCHVLRIPVPPSRNENLDPALCRMIQISKLRSGLTAKRTCLVYYGPRLDSHGIRFC